MAIVTPIIKRVTDRVLGTLYGEAFQVSWVLTSGGDIEGAPFVAPAFNDISIQYYSDDWNGKILSFRGSLQTLTTPTKWFNLTDGAQVKIAETANGGNTVLENAYQYSPILDGSPTSNLTVIALFTKKR